MYKKKIVIFDFADTIAYLSPSKEKILQDFIRQEIGLEIDLVKIKEVYHYVTNLYFYSSVDIKTLNMKELFYIEFNRKVLSLLALEHLIDAKNLFQYFSLHGQHWYLKDNVHALFETLKEEKYLLSLVSNFDKRLYSILEEMKIQHLFDSIFISQEEGLEKPNPSFFSLVLEKHKLKAEEAFFIGDSYHLDFLPSKRLGMSSILLDEDEHYPFLAKEERITSLAACKRILLSA